ncbi:uncharacterized protein LOC133292178 [Gastrolobium bilobum]|uniref:uncharacterized protein LOC133292178 n=1 Tax=Gastrolobium bilobum TaxID=150636 RepID=UPI002AB1933D|nr:uncharacterized protein LOC133292178 [Gastrolobium bilobum]
MASKQETIIPLKLWVDKERKLVVMAEASGDFVDVLFSFLTLPLGTIIRLVSKNQPHQPVEIGCLNNLYQSVEDFSTDVFWNHICKKMLLSPANPCEALCKRLKLNVDDTDTKYYMCSSCLEDNDWLLSTFGLTSCSCGKLMDKEMKLVVESNEETHENGVFVKEKTMFLIFDDLRVLKSSPGNTVQQLLQLGYRDFNKMTEMSLKVGMKEISSIVKQALTSKSPLSDVFLANGESKPMYSFSPHAITGPRRFGNFRYSVDLKITVCKSENKIMFAEAEEDFVDFLFSFLTIPVGSILRLTYAKLSLGCMDNLYTSVKDLNSSWFIGSSGTSLLNMRVAPQYGCKRQLLSLSEEDTPSYWYGYGTGVMKTNTGSVQDGTISKEMHKVQYPQAMKLFDPRSPDGRRDPAVGFVRRPSLFVVLDDLKVTPLTTTSSISFLQKLNVPLDDLEEHVVEIGAQEALNLLAASLTSKAPLTESLFCLLKKPKEEIQIIL